MRKLFVLFFTLISLAVSGAALTLTEVGFRLDLALNPFRIDGKVKWDITLGAYGLFTIDEAWSARIAVGSRVDGFYPFAEIGLDRTVIPRLYAEGVLAVRSAPGRGLTTSAFAGARYIPDVGTEGRLEIASLPFGWILTSYAGKLHGRFFLSPSLSVDGSLISPHGGLIGQGLDLFVVQSPPGADPPLLPIGGGYALAGGLRTRIGFAL